MAWRRAGDRWGSGLINARNKENMDKLVWHNEKRKISDLIHFEGNPRQMTKKQADDLKKSLEKFNLVEIPAIDTDNKIIIGHQRLKILQLLNRGEEEIDVRIPNRKLTEEEFREYNIISNKVGGSFDFDLLANFGGDLLDVGFSSKEIDKIMGKDSEGLGYMINCPHCNEKIKVSNRVKIVEKFIDNGKV